MNIKRNILLNPGPATTTDSVKKAQLVPDICPRENEFEQIMDSLCKDLIKVVHGDESEYVSVLFCGSGTICMDVALNSLLPADKKVLLINNGAYTSRAVEICQYYGLPYIELKFSEVELPDLRLIEQTLMDNQDIALVYTTHQETGTGILNPIKDIGRLSHQYNAVFVVDTTSTYAMIPIHIEDDNIDFCMSSAQKGLMAMAGLSFIIGKRKLIQESKKYPKRSYYCNLYLQYHYFEMYRQMHFTPPVQTIYAARKAMDEYFLEGEKNKWIRHTQVYEVIYRGLTELGFKILIKKEWMAGLCICAIYPDDSNWEFQKIHDYCYDKGYTIYPGKIVGTNTFRLCAFGAIDVNDIKAFFEVFKLALQMYNIKIPVRYDS